LACSAAIATINVILRDKLWEVAAAKGSYLIEKVTELADEFPQLYDKVTGRGLLIGQHFQTPELGYNVASELFKRGVLVSGTLTSAQTVRIEPPLVIEQTEIDEGLNRLRDAVGAVAKSM
jgi:putrescine aminotransferase